MDKKSFKNREVTAGARYRMQFDFLCYGILLPQMRIADALKQRQVQFNHEQSTPACPWLA
jgi:hypothetical protein